MKILNKIEGFVYRKIEELKGFQGNLKELTIDGYEKLKASFFVHGNIAPVYIWKDNILDGHQRIKTLKKLKAEGVKIPKLIPCLTIKAKSKKEAKTFLLQYISQHGRVTEDGLYEYLHEAGLDDQIQELKNQLDIPELDINEFISGYMEEDPGDDQDDKKLSDFQSITFTLQNEQARQVREALRISKEAGEFIDTGNESEDGNAIARICENYLTNI